MSACWNWGASIPLKVLMYSVYWWASNGTAIFLISIRRKEVCAIIVHLSVIWLSKLCLTSILCACILLPKMKGCLGRVQSLLFIDPSKLCLGLAMATNPYWMFHRLSIVLTEAAFAFRKLVLITMLHVHIAFITRMLDWTWLTLIVSIATAKEACAVLSICTRMALFWTCVLALIAPKEPVASPSYVRSNSASKIRPVKIYPLMWIVSHPPNSWNASFLMGMFQQASLPLWLLRMNLPTGISLTKYLTPSRQSMIQLVLKLMGGCERVSV